LREPPPQVVYMRRNPRAIVCITSALIHKDPIASSLSRITYSASWPSLLRAGDPTESSDTCETIVDTVMPEVAKLSGDILVMNLKWGRMPDHLEKVKAAIIGTRFILARKEKLESTRKWISDAGMEVFYDDGFYGGGLLAYELVRALNEKADATVVEVTLSRTAAESANIIRSLLQAVTSI